MIGHAKKMFFLATASLFLIVLVSFIFYLHSRPNQNLAGRDADKIYHAALTNQLNADYLYSGRPVSKSQYIHRLQANLSHRLLLSSALTYNKIRYHRQQVLHRIAGDLYRLQFADRTGRIVSLNLVNRHQVRVRYNLRSIHLRRILDHMSSQSEEDLSRAQRDSRLTNLSQPETALLQYILIANNWRHYLTLYSGRGQKIQSSFTMFFDPRKRRFMISRQTLLLIQASGVSNE